ncbi:MULTISPECIES: TIR domain-containing protein [Microcystis]|jgi:hypothetical protein|uniref:Stress-response A/B barrel domain-containing protein n=2 Tax=Microcystis TaxID=1125 RepID=L7EAU4_MICAE|nr:MULTISPECIES: TIR domain-containing protein [Microcystis]ELP56119.1 hypothetical protein O53_719 [Microcystis aeruginosa TAIHU98]MBD2598953.1 TIR domain-containing protein [Microcystis viridis FACHB-1342]MDB9387217.1 TIR domain-containing protein [Microcystis aeruginosa CS-583]ODV36970.1 hypothetical protein BFG60_3625 [Microcystis aeruginosa NIES-98]ROH99118.1 TIR domain-containing protein [Microcystis aeruginosa FACHB-524]
MTLKVFVSYSWDLLNVRAAIQERLRLLDVIPVVDREIVSHENRSIHENIRKHLLESDLVVVVFAQETLKSVEVREELTLAHTWGIPVICFVDKNLDSNDRDKIPWFLRDKLECRYNSQSKSSTDEILEQLNGVINRKLTEKTKPDSNNTFSKLEIHRIIRASNERLMDINDQEHFRLSIAQNVVRALNQELENLSRSDYTVDLSLDQNFLLRASGLFANATRIYATSIDSLSSFWIANNPENAIGYTRIQPSNTMRLFVFSSALSMHQYRYVLTEQHKQYGSDGAVFMCSIDSYNLLVGSLLNANLRRRLAGKDFAFLEFGDQAKPYLATLSSDTLHCKQLDSASVYSSLKDAFDNFACLQKLERDDQYKVLKWVPSFANHDPDWKLALEALFSPEARSLSRRQVFHHIFFHSRVVTGNNAKALESAIVKAISVLRQIPKRRDDSEMLIKNITFGQMIPSESINNLKVLDGRFKGQIIIGNHHLETFPYCLSMALDSIEDLEYYYSHPLHSEAREEIFSACDDRIRKLYKMIHNESSPQIKADLYHAIEGIANGIVVRADYFDVDRLDYVLKTEPVKFA